MTTTPARARARGVCVLQATLESNFNAPREIALARGDSRDLVLVFVS